MKPSNNVTFKDGPFSRYALSKSDMANLIGENNYRVNQIWAYLYRNYSNESARSPLPRSILNIIDSRPEFNYALAEKAIITSDSDLTTKLLLNTRDNLLIESVLMNYGDRVSLCISSQAGCAMGCKFCATGQNGFKRHLTKAEIVEQLVHANRINQKNGRKVVSHILFMGMGEPLANFKNVVEAVAVFVNQFSVSKRNITLSTVGIPGRIEELSQLKLGITLAVSLHSLNQNVREQLIPIARQYSLDNLIRSLKSYSEKNRRISLEWTMIRGVNDSAEELQNLANLAKELKAHVNLIPLNPTPGFNEKATDLEKMKESIKYLIKKGVNATLRQTKGSQIKAACGQLAGLLAT